MLGKRVILNPRWRLSAIPQMISAKSQPMTSQDVKAALDNPGITWVTLYGIHEAGLVAEMGEIFDLTPFCLKTFLTPPKGQPLNYSKTTSLSHSK